MEKPILPVVAGPTASGKTACGVALCQRLGGEIVSADSMQLYRGMEVLTAAPTLEERQGIPHHLVGCVDPRSRFTADAFRETAKATIGQIRARGRQPVLCGGTGLYIDAVTRPMSFSAPSDQAMHEALMDQGSTTEGRLKLHETLRSIDPDAAARLHVNDVRRVARAIEIYRLTGVTQTEQVRRDQSRSGDFREIIFALDWPRETLYHRIDERVEGMLRAGLVDEVRRLMSDEAAHPTAIQAIGYKEIAAALRGEISMEAAVYKTKQASRNLAKRQITWFKRDSRVIWLSAEGGTADSLAERMVELLKERFGTQIASGRRPDS